MDILNSEYAIPLFIGVLVLIAVCIGFTLTNKDNKKTSSKKINKEDNDGHEQYMSKAEKVGFVNFGDTEDLEYVQDMEI